MFLIEKYQELSEKFDVIFKEATELRKDLEKKQIELSTIEKFFGERENDFQK